MPSRFQLHRDLVRAVFGPAENQRAIEIRAFEQRHEQIEFLFGRHRINRMRDRLGRRTARADLNHLGRTQNPRSEPLDFGRQSRGKEQRLSIGRNLLNNSPNIRQKTHVEHAIHFVEHENIHVAQIHRPLFEQIEQPARCP